MSVGSTWPGDGNDTYPPADDKTRGAATTVHSASCQSPPLLMHYQVGILAGLSQHLITQDCTIPTTRQSCAGIAKGVALAPSPSAHSPRHLHQARVHMLLSIVCARIPAQDPGNARDEISIIARADTQRPRWRHT